MHGPNHGCPKCVINDGFIAAIARLLAFTVGEGSQLHKPALALAFAAETAGKVFEHAFATGIRSKPDGHDFKGCDEATTLMSYVTLSGDDAKSGVGTDAALAEIKRIHADILDHIADLVSNKDNSEKE